MKKLIFLLSLLTVISCKKSEEKNDEPGIMDAIEGVKNLNNAADAVKDFEKRAEELKGLTPVSKEVFKEILVEKIDNLTRSNYNAGTVAMVGLNTAEATYGDETGKTVKVSIFDGAGETGSAMISMANLTLSMDSESIDKTTTKKTEEINGTKCSTENDTNPNYIRSSITYILKDRYQIILEGNKMSLDELKTYMKKFDFSKLD